VVFEVLHRGFDDGFVSVDDRNIHIFVKDNGSVDIKEKYMKSRTFNLSSLLRVDNVWYNHMSINSDIIT